MMNGIPEDPVAGWTPCDPEEPAPTTSSVIRLRGRADERPPPAPPRIGTVFGAALERVKRRASGQEKPVALPWSVLADHFGGGLWPGLHVVNKGTGVGGTQFALQVATNAAKHGVPALYIGLELGELDLALRMLGEEAHVPWSHLWTGKAGPTYLARVAEAVPVLADIPFHFEVARPHGFSASAIRNAVEGMRAAYPETDGPGSRPIVVVVDFLQLIGDEIGDDQDVRIRIGRAAYQLRELAKRDVVLAISSVARERYKLLNEIHTAAGLSWKLDDDGYPIERRIANTDAIVGAGKESGELEYSADSVSVLARVGETWNGKGCDVVIATAKGRATGAMWSPLHFTGFRYEECSDRGGRMVDAWKDAGERRERDRAEKRAAKGAARDEERSQKLTADAEAVRAYVLAHPGCSVREARVHAVADQPRRWSAAVAALGAALVHSKSKSSSGRQQTALIIEEPGR